MIRAIMLLLAQAIVLILLRNSAVEAISANPNPIFVNDGHHPIYLKGDETLHWYEDSNGYTLIDDPENKNDDTSYAQNKVYAKLDDESGELISTGIRLGEFLGDNTTINGGGGGLRSIQKHLKPVRNKIQTIRPDEQNQLGHHRNLQEHTNRRKLMSNTNTLKNLVILIRFADHTNRTLPSVQDYDVLLNGPGGEGTVAPTRSVNDVFLANSYGTFSLDSIIYPSWITLSHTEAYYADKKSGLGPAMFEAIREALDIIDADPNFDLSQFNTDYNQGDPFIDAITIIHSGYGAEFGGSDCYGNIEVNRIWSHSWFMYTGTWTSQDGTVSVSNYHINPGLWGVCGSEISRIGVIAHETCHFLGLPDLYDPQGGNGIGTYCLMSDSWGIDASQYYPPMLSPWSKIELGWITPTILETSGDFTIRQSWQYPEVYKIELLGSSSEYLLIENRQPGSFDALLGLGGLAIWHVDDYNQLYSNSREGYPGQSDWPANNLHYHVALLQADGKYDLEKGDNRGDYGDLFRYDAYFGVDHLFPSEEANPLLGPFPNTDSYRQGIVTRTNHFISDISATSPEMSFSFLQSSPCEFDEVYFELLLLIDGNGSEVSWALQETYSDTIVLSGHDYDDHAQVNINQCLPRKCYTFVMYDAGNDGLCCENGTGGYNVRLNGLKVASGTEYGIMNRQQLQCMIPPTASPTPAPFAPTTIPSEMPSSTPSSVPSSIPTGVCGRNMGLLEIFVEGSDFVDDISWSLEDIIGNSIVSSTDINSNGSLYYVQGCITLNSCYTFSIQDSLGDNIYNIKLDGEIMVSGSNFHGDHSTMFGASCLQNNTPSEHNVPSPSPTTRAKPTISAPPSILSTDDTLSPPSAVPPNKRSITFKPSTMAPSSSASMFCLSSAAVLLFIFGGLFIPL